MYKDKNIPLYKQILNDLKYKLNKGFWNIGDIFPSDKELMEMYSVSSITVRRVILELVNEGWIERRHGIGTFVKKEFVEPLERLVGFFDEIRAKGRVPSAKVLFADNITVSEQLLEEVPNLEFFRDEKIFLIKKVHLIDYFPVEVVDSYWISDVGMEIVKFDIKTQGLYEIINKQFGIQIAHREQELRAISASLKIAAELGIAEGVPVLRADRISHDNDGKAIEVAVNVYHPTNYRCRIVSNREDQVDVFFDPDI
ncbi:MAG: GntR family transcriptional regulator [Bacillota bacterium]